MPYLGLFIIIFAFVQCAAGVSGLMEFGFHPVIAIAVGGAVLVFVPSALALPGIYGAIQSWHWHWFWAVMLFFPALIPVLTTTGFLSLASIWQAYAEPRVAGRTETVEDEVRAEQPRRCGLAALEFPSIADRKRVLADGGTLWPWLLVPTALVLCVVAAIVLHMLEGDSRESSHVAVPSVPSAQSSAEDLIKLDASFDCRRTTNPADGIVCLNPALVALDREMAGLYASLLVESGATDDWQFDQLQWTKRVRDVCSTFECLHAAYGNRIQALRIATASRLANGTPLSGDTAAAQK